MTSPKPLDSPINAASWTVHGDGACRGNPGPASYGVVIHAHDVAGAIVASHELSGYIGRATNQVAELTAALRGLEVMPAGARVTLVSDSQYTLKGLTEWRAGWERKGMKNSKGEIVANLELWKQLYAAADKVKLKTQWVRGHNGHEHNERCDVLANLAIEQAVGRAA